MVAHSWRDVKEETKQSTLINDSGRHNKLDQEENEEQVQLVFFVAAVPKEKLEGKKWNKKIGTARQSDPGETLLLLLRNAFNLRG